MKVIIELACMDCVSYDPVNYSCLKLKQHLNLSEEMPMIPPMDFFCSMYEEKPSIDEDGVKIDVGISI